MNDSPVVRQPLHERGLFKYGMLAFILVLWVYSWYAWFTRAPQEHSATGMNVAVTSMLLVNHVVAYFLSIENQRRVRVAQFLVIGACLFYVFRGAFH